MKRVTLVKFLLSVAVLLQLAFVSHGQSSSDIEMAKEYAKSMGYSDADINNAIASFSSGGSAALQPGSSLQNDAFAVTDAVDRNVGVEIAKADSVALNKGRRDSLASNKINVLAADDEAIEIFGRNIFRKGNLDFVPNYNIPTPADYKLAAGDEVIIDVWGDVMTNITATITAEGYISVPNMGLMYIAGMSVEKAEDNIRQGLSKIYSRLNKEEGENHVKLSLGKTRSVTVNVVGDVVNPGSYTVPSLSTLAMVMYMSGGPDGIGSVRNINLYRGGKLLSTLDVYDFLMNGVYDKNVRLEDNDIISVAPYDGIVAIEGGVKRAMRYEITDGEKLSALLKYAGGLTHSAFGGSIVVERISAMDDVVGAVAQSFVVKSDEFDKFELKSGDRVIVSENLDRFANRAEIAGAVWREGSYAIGEQENQASDLYELIELAGGLRDDAFLKRAYIERYGENRQREQVTFSPMEVILKSVNVELKPDDRVVILTLDEVTTQPTVNIAGEVNNPDQYDYRKNMTLGDLIIMAGGVTNGATITNVEIARRKLDVDNQVESDTVATVLNVNLLSNPKEAEMVLMPYDMVFVRKSINYHDQMSVTVSGEVKYPGTYVIENNTVRLSDLVANSGGLSRDAYIYGASLKRVLTAEDLLAIEASDGLVDANGNPIAEAGKMGRVAIDLAAAMENPGSVSDLVLKEGDVLTIPQFDNTVSITGHVMNPNSIVFRDKTSLKDYISAAGGYKVRAKKSRIYVVQMNGMMAKRGNKEFEIKPGSTIVVPEKPEKRSLSQTTTFITSFSTILIAMLGILL
ncbi:MAG: SLBB domain-containing protein [Rikenellaceae bacterium]